jgi:hypothetical protein
VQKAASRHLREPPADSVGQRAHRQVGQEGDHEVGRGPATNLKPAEPARPHEQHVVDEYERGAVRIDETDRIVAANDRFGRTR